MFETKFGASGIADLQTALSFLNTSTWTAITHLGDGLLPLLLFVGACIARRIEFALVMGILSSSTGIIVGLLKQLIQEPRPYLIGDEFTVYAMGSGFGMPSGHSATGLITLVVIGLFLHRKHYFLLLIPLIVLVGLSRVYLGVHTLGQVIAGWLVALVVLGVYALSKNGIASETALINKALLLNLAIISAVLFGLFHFYVDAYVQQHFRIPELWQQNDIKVFNILSKGDDEYSPLSLFQAERIVLVGLYLGFCIAAVLDWNQWNVIAESRFKTIMNGMLISVGFVVVFLLSGILEERIYFLFVLFTLFPIFTVILSPALIHRLMSDTARA